MTQDLQQLADELEVNNKETADFIENMKQKIAAMDMEYMEQSLEMDKAILEMKRDEE